ncbi:MAG: histidine kinase [Clostridium sp.]|nr:histidine kinase [Clostridium sp.]
MIEKIRKRIKNTDNQKYKYLYLNRTVMLIVMVGYSSFLVLILLLDWYLIHKYQLENAKTKQDAVNAYTEKTQNSMDNIDMQLSEVFINDKDFRALQGNQESLVEYGHAYELRETLRNRMAIDENFNGFYIFYHGYQKVWYHVDGNKINAVHARKLREFLGTPPSADDGRSWNSFSIDGTIYLILNFRRENVSLYGIYILPNAQTAVSESSGDNPKIILLGPQGALANEELAQNLNLSSETKKHMDSFSERITRYQIYGSRIPNADIWVCAAYPVNIWTILNGQQLLLLALTVLSILAVVFMRIFIQNQLVRPLRQLINTMNSIRNGSNEEIPPLDCRFYEMQEVNNTLGEMVDELKEQKLLVYEEIIEKQKAQMQYLQLQLKPHFYLNGLKTLNALAMEGHTDKMQELILNLSVHLRYLLQAERELVPLKMELDFVENYVDMQKHVSGRPVSCEITKDDEADDWPVPILAVQTFVENSVKYARLGDSNVTLEIQIAASCLCTEEGNFLDLVVQDNGQGYPEEILQEINQDVSKGTRSVGINNIKRRCRILYGEKAEYSFNNYDGAISELVIPERVQ